MRLRAVIALACLGLLASLGSAAAKPPLEAFGDVPGIRAMELSPDGKRVAYIQRTNGVDTLVIHEFETQQGRGLAKVTDIRARDVHFVGNDYVVLIASTDTRISGFRGRHEFSAAFAFNLKTGKFVQLLRNTDNIYPGQSGLGNIVGLMPGGAEVLMPAYMGAIGSDPTMDLLRVPLDSGRGFRITSAKGTSSTIDWIVTRNGQPLAREEFNTKGKIHEISVRNADNSGWREIYRKNTELPDIGVVGATADGQSLVVTDARDSEFMSLYSMSIADGTISPPLMQREDADVARVISDGNRVVHGVLYSGMFPTYDMFDPTVEENIKTVQNSLGTSAVYLDSWSDDWTKMLFFTEGGRHAERYLMYDTVEKKLTLVATSRPGIKPEDVGQVITVEYKARDGLKIPSLITWPTNVAEAERKNLPLIVLPHGGPQVYDAVGFDWLAQYLANEGYMVLQHNFRGSAGFGGSFATAGHGQWGRKMQDDITDGAKALATMGWADPKRTCIVGWSYGGYAALAGGALTPDLYKCVVAIAGVSSLREMMAEDRRQYGPRSRTVTWWERLIGDPSKDAAAIDAVSPSLLADNFKAPVLLIHGAADTVVPIRQSELMHDALRKAKKDVRYIRIDGDDHGLVEDASRRQVLTAISEFLNAHIGAKPLE
jgi:dipeptidyl aminopeptidase/acylaminoacyl peptidase